MRQFNTPPEWPAAPRPDWQPPRRWQPPQNWPPPPRRWAFWVDEQGRPVRGPIGRYGGPRRTTALAIVVVPVVLMTLVLVNPFGDGPTGTAPLYQASVPAHPTPITRTTAPPPRPAPTPLPTPTRRTEQPVRLVASTPTPSRATTRRLATLSTPAPTPTPSLTPTFLPSPTPTEVVYKNCAEVRAAGKAPLHRGDPGYSEQLDHNGDGVACGDRGNS
ncbi:excalibur calcium-binding domain-containing protein [Kribbella sp. WER1]